MHVRLFRSLGFCFETATEDRPAACCLLQHFVTVCRPTGGMTAVPSREVTTSQVSAVTFGFYTEREVSLLHKLPVRTVVPTSPIELQAAYTKCLA